MAIQNVDKHNGFIIRKLMSPDHKKCFGYLTLPDGYDGRDVSKVQKFNTLGEARTAIDKPHADNVKTLPKSSYPQNQKGYRADSFSKKRAA